LGNLGSYATGAVPALIAEYQDSSNSFRFQAAAARVKIDKDWASVQEVFAVGIQDPNRSTAALALTEMAQIGGICPGAADLLISAIRSSNRNTRMQAINLTSRFGTNALAATEALKEASADTNAAVRRVATVALTNLENIRREMSKTKLR
jgi:hypothetical protein